MKREGAPRGAKAARLTPPGRPATPAATTRGPGQIARAQGGEYHAILDELFPLFVHPSRRDNAELRQLVHDMGDDVGPEAFVRQQTAIMSRPDSRPTLAAIECPTLVLSSDEDNTVPNSLSTEIAGGIPGAKLVVIPDCGHTTPWEQPQATADALVEWLLI